MAEKNEKYPEPTDADHMILAASLAVTGPRIEFDDGVENDSEYTERVMESVRFVSILAQSGSRVMRTIMDFNNAVVYPANIAEVGFEKKSQRPLVQLEVKPSKYAKDGEEEIRGLRTDEPGGEALYEQLKGLVDRRVLIYKGFDKSERSEGKGFKKIMAVRDLGEAEDFD